MNECIKRMLLQTVPMAGEDGEYLPGLYTERQIETFALLIIQECADLFADTGKVQIGTRALWQESAKTTILKHFGQC